MQFVYRDVKINYEIYGSGIPVVMIHGCQPDHRLMKGCMEPVFQTIEPLFQRIYFDLPGMGLTKAEPWIENSDHILEIITGFINGIIPRKRFILAGESYGGYLARGLIKYFSTEIDGMLLICPTGEPLYDKAVLPPPQVFETDENLLSRLSSDERQQFESINVIQTEKVWNRFKNEILSGLIVTDNDFIERVFGKSCSLSFNANKLESPFMKPSLMVMGRQDFIVGYHDMLGIVEDYPRATFAVLDKAGHNLQIEQDHLFNELVQEWLQRVMAERS